MTSFALHAWIYSLNSYLGHLNWSHNLLVPQGSCCFLPADLTFYEALSASFCSMDLQIWEAAAFAADPVLPNQAPNLMWQGHSGCLLQSEDGPPITFPQERTWSLRRASRIMFPHPCDCFVWQGLINNGTSAPRASLLWLCSAPFVLGQKLAWFSSFWLLICCVLPLHTCYWIFILISWLTTYMKQSAEWHISWFCQTRQLVVEKSLDSVEFCPHALRCRL